MVHIATLLQQLMQSETPQGCASTNIETELYVETKYASRDAKNVSTMYFECWYIYSPPD